MCGLVGIVRGDGPPLDLRRLRAATEALRHRGPDDEGYLVGDTATPRLVAHAGPDTPPELELAPLPESCGGDLALGFRRLSIVDLSSDGHQPMGDRGGRHWLAFNGEVYNHVELRSELEQRGRHFVGHSDTEVVLAALVEWGAAALDRFVGMWALAWLDVGARSLLLSRDPFGIKPLFVHTRPGGIAFASEIGALRILEDVAPRACPAAAYDYVRFGWTDHRSETLYAGIDHLPPGRILRIDCGSGRTQTATLDAVEPTPAGRPHRTLDDAAEALRELLLESVRLHLRSDVPVGTALSGGIDSSGLLCAMRRHAGPAARLHAFSHVAEDPTLSEDHWSALAARSAGAERHVVRPDAAGLRRDLDALLDAQGEPFGSTSIYAQYRVFRLAREHGVPVLLDGQGADELFAGYPSYLASAIAGDLLGLRVGRALRLMRAASDLLPRRDLLIRTGAGLLPAGAAPWARRVSGESLVPPWLDGDWLARQGVAPRHRFPRAGRDRLQRHLALAFESTSLPSLLRYEDRNAMAHSVESRVPFVTPALARFARSLPSAHLIDADATTKAVLRRALRGLVPDAILDRRDKIGFATDEDAWLRALAPELEADLLGDAGRAIPLLRPDGLRREWRDFRAGHARFDFRFWRWVNLSRWTQRNEIDWPP